MLIIFLVSLWENNNFHCHFNAKNIYVLKVQIYVDGIETLRVYPGQNLTKFINYCN